jgi:hypothetical protein
MDLISLKGIPKEIDGNFYCYDLKFTEKEIRAVCNIKGDIDV